MLKKIADSYFFILFLAFFFGLVFPDILEKVAPFSAFLLGSIFFLSALKMNLKEVLDYLHDKKMILTVMIFMLIALPIVVYYVTLLIFPAIAIALLLLAAMPSGMTTPLLSEISGGKQSLALVFVVLTSLLAPITVPLVVELVAGASISVGFWDMFLSLAKVIFIPFILAEIVKYFFDSRVQKVSGKFKPISVIFLGLLIAGIIARQADVIIEGFLGGRDFLYIIYLFAFFVVLHFLGYFTIWWRNREERITITVSLTYMNFTLAIYLVDQFFTDPNIVVPVVLSILPWALLLPPFKYFVQKI